MNSACPDLHLVLQNSHVSLLHYLVERHEFSKALGNSHDLSLSGQVQRQLQGRVEPHFPCAEATQTRFRSTLRRSFDPLNYSCVPQVKQLVLLMSEQT